MDERIEIDEQFRQLIPPLAAEEYKQLEANIIADGCRDPLVVWAMRPSCETCDENGEEADLDFDRWNRGDEYSDDFYSWRCHTCNDYGDTGEEYILLDGHNRLAICKDHDIGYDVVYKLFSTREEAADWIDANQLGRRNLDPIQMSLIRGRRHNRAEKKPGQRTDLTSDQNDPRLNTAERLGQQYGVSASTIKRDGQFAAAVEVLGLEAEVASGDVSASKEAIVEAAKPILAAVKKGDTPSDEDIQKAKAKAHVAHNSGQNEWYTPAEFIEAAKAVFGGAITTDPASSEIANKTVGATLFYTKEQNGLGRAWAGNVWLNPPYAQPLVSQFADAVVEKYIVGEFVSAIVLVNNATETTWFQRMANAAAAICFPKSRVKFLDPEGKPGSPLQGQAVLYMGERPDAFVDAFSQFGFCTHVALVEAD